MPDAGTERGAGDRFGGELRLPAYLAADRRRDGGLRRAGLATGLGLAGLFQAEPRLHTALKYAGAAYLLYLAWRIATAAPAKAGTTRSRPLSFAEGVLVTWLNPKGWITTIGALAAFTTADGKVALQTMVIALALAVACGGSLLLWAGFGAAIARWLGRPAARRAFNGAMGGLLVLSLVPVFA